MIAIATLVVQLFILAAVCLSFYYSRRTARTYMEITNNQQTKLSNLENRVTRLELGWRSQR